MIIEAKGLVKRYGDTLAVDNIDLEVRRGSIVGVLGPNGAGKTTTLRMLTTLAKPDAGSARVAGFDVVHEAASIRRIIGVTGQDATLDELLSGRQNLVMTGELSRMGRTPSRQRAQELLELLELEEAADRPVKGYSGGMRRRLDLAASIVSKPPILFLDEPTTGLDPTGRQKIWNIIRDLVESGATVLLTTQYLDEADALADEVVVIRSRSRHRPGEPIAAESGHWVAVARSISARTTSGRCRHTGRHRHGEGCRVGWRQASARAQFKRARTGRGRFARPRRRRYSRRRHRRPSALPGRRLRGLDRKDISSDQR